MNKIVLLQRRSDMHRATVGQSTFSSRKVTCTFFIMVHTILSQYLVKNVIVWLDKFLLLIVYSILKIRPVSYTEHPSHS